MCACKKQPVGHALDRAANRLSSLFLDPAPALGAGATGYYRPQGVGVAGDGAAACCGFFVDFLAADFFEPFAFADRFFGDFFAAFFLAGDFFLGDFFAVFLAAFFFAIRWLLPL
jgi:hypothetical protein